MEKKQVIQFVVRDDGILPWSPCLITVEMLALSGRASAEEIQVLDTVSHAMPV